VRFVCQGVTRSDGAPADLAVWTQAGKGEVSSTVRAPCAALRPRLPARLPPGRRLPRRLHGLRLPPGFAFLQAKLERLLARRRADGGRGSGRGHRRSLLCSPPRWVPGPARRTRERLDRLVRFGQYQFPRDPTGSGGKARGPVVAGRPTGPAAGLAGQGEGE